MIKKTLLFILDAHVPYIPDDEDDGSGGQSRFFELLTYGFMPFLQMCSRLEKENIPFRCGLVISPLVCEMLSNPSLQERYLADLDAHIAFKEHELHRCADAEICRNAVEAHCSFLTRTRYDFCEHYNKNILKQIKYFSDAGYIELLATAAIPCFFPFYRNTPESLRAQIELGLESFRDYFSRSPDGFWMPAMGYTAGAERLLKTYGIKYSILESQSFLFAKNPPATGVFLPAAAENGCMFFAKDCLASEEVQNAKNGFYLKAPYLDTDKDIGFDLVKDYLSPLFDVKKGRRATGYAYWARGGHSYYDSRSAYAAAEADAALFLDNRRDALEEAGTLLHTKSLCSLSVFPLQFLGRIWREGMYWFEQIFRLAAEYSDMEVSLPAVYSTSVRQVQSVAPFYASNLPSGYADELVHSKNDWMFFSIQKATERMIDLVTRFPNEDGLKERILNTAAKEIMFVQSIDWPLMVDSEIYGEYAEKRCKEHILAFTNVYEALGSGAIDTEFLIKREKRYPFFPDLDYRLFARNDEKPIFETEVYRF